MRLAVPAFALAAVVAVSLSGCSGPAADVVQASYQLPSEADVKKSLAGPLTWYSGVLDVFDDVAAEVPEIAGLRDAVAAHDAEFGAAVLAQFGNPSSVVSGEALSWSGRGTSRSDDGSRGFQNLMIGGLAGIAQTAGQNVAGTGNLQPGQSGITGGVTLTQNDDGTTTIEISDKGQQGEAGATAGTSLTVVYDGRYCPGPDGTFDATAKSERIVTGTAGGATVSRTENVKATISGRLGDNALPEELNMEATQMTSTTGADGATKYLTTTQKSTDGTFSGLNPDTNPPKRLGGTKGLSEQETKDLSAQGQLDAGVMVLGLLMSLVQMWTDGGCVSIDADLPEHVTPKSVDDFTVKVTQKLTGSSVKGPLKLELEGAETLEPSESVSPGGFHYTAGDPGTTATITITSTSRQGGATKKLPVTVGFEGWEVDGTAAGIHVHGGLCASAWENWSAPQNILAWTDDGEQFLNLRHYPDGDDVSGSFAPPDASSPFGSWQLQRDAAGQPVGITAELSFISRSTADVFTLPASFTVYPATRDITCTEDGTAHFDRFN